MSNTSNTNSSQPRGIVNTVIRFCLEQKLVVAVLLGGTILWGLLVAPFDWNVGDFQRNPVPVDAIPDIGENQQIVFTEWPGRSPQDIDDQISYPLTVSLLGIPGVKDVRSYSVFGFSTIYIVFEDGIDFYWSRSRVLEKLNSLSSGTLPTGVVPSLGPDATALGQVFWYTLEGRDADGNPTGGWDLDELRSIQDFIVKYKLAGVQGIAEVASIGGFVKEYQVDVNPDAMRAAGITLGQVIDAVRQSNLDVGARTIEVNRAEYVIRGIGFIQDPSDLELAAITSRETQPILVGDIATVSLGPALRRGVLTKAGSETVGGVVVVRYGENPMATIQRVKEKINNIASGLPSKMLPDGTESRVTVVPFYDRTGLIQETLKTLNSAIEQQVLVTIIVVVLMVMHLRSSILIGAMLPITVLMTFIGMKLFRVDANIVALSGIAIAIGTVVDMGIVLSENILRALEEANPEDSRLEVIYQASAEVGGAVLTAVATTVVGFLPVFTMEAAEGKLFKPLAYTKTFALLSSVIIALTILPAVAHVLLGYRVRDRFMRTAGAGALLVGGLVVLLFVHAAGGLVLAGFGVYYIAQPYLNRTLARACQWSANLIAVGVVLVTLASTWEPVGPEAGVIQNTLFIGVVVGLILLAFWCLRVAFPSILAWTLRHKLVALTPVVMLVMVGSTIWLGFERVWGWLPASVRQRAIMVDIAHTFPGMGSEFMPALDEGAFLYMPTTMPHASIGEATDILKELDLRIMSVPEVELAVGKIGRVESPLDPAPTSMIETIIQYKSEYMEDAFGRRLSFRYDVSVGDFVRDERGNLIEDNQGRPFRQWRDTIESPQDIWNEIVAAADMPGVTSAPKLQPIETRVVMLQSGFRAPMGIKVYGPDLESIESFGLQLERLLKEVPSVQPAAVFADRVVGKPYLEIEIDREKIARYGLRIADVQQVIEVAIGGKPLAMTVEGRERYPIRVRYMRELRDEPETLGDILVPTPAGAQVPLRELATIQYRRGPQMIKSEDTFLVSYVLFDKVPGNAEVSVVDDASRYIKDKIKSGDLEVPAGVSYEFAGSYKNQVRAAKRLMIVLPLSLAVIFLLLYLQFRKVSVTLMVFSGVFVAWSGGFLMLWLYAQPWFMDFALLGVNMREFLQIKPYNLSVAVWVGFLALFGIATDDGVIMATRIEQTMLEEKPHSIEAIRLAVVRGGRLRIRAAVMTTATTVLALLPVLSSSGRGSDIMIPMAIPTFGGMAVASLTWFVVPILYCWGQELKHRFGFEAQQVRADT
ncbi:MAG: efflux RND transporter permease subunit [Phycisphaeraceae bacterium]|nr:efflux RND transporter permease subunit [Phycisphaerales bacterium]MCB9860373.1 efflux RND transporter permease subunit [Phycisphaeraceae bacterium]